MNNEKNIVDNDKIKEEILKKQKVEDNRKDIQYDNSTGKINLID